MSRIAIVDYGMGNVRSIANALNHLGDHDVQVTANHQALADADGIILPGVGAFGDAMANLADRDLIEVLDRQVKKQGKYLLGICLGMQLLLERSAELGDHKGLGWIPGTVERLHPADGLRVPHVGWNDVVFTDDDELYAGLPDDHNFYFVHSFHAVCSPEHRNGYFDYGGEFTASVRRDNVIGFQFHPEKSQRNGFVLLRNFIKLLEGSAC